MLRLTKLLQGIQAFFKFQLRIKRGHLIKIITCLTVKVHVVKEKQSFIT